MSTAYSICKIRARTVSPERPESSNCNTNAEQEENNMYLAQLMYWKKVDYTYINHAHSYT